MIPGRLVPVVGPQVELKTSTFSLWEGFDVGVRAHQDHLEISRIRPSRRDAPIINIALESEFLLHCIGRGHYHELEGKHVFGTKLRQEELGTVDLVYGIDAQRDGPDRHYLRSVEFSYFEEISTSGESTGFYMLFDIVYGEGVPGQGQNGWSSHAEVTGHRKWVECAAPWSMLYDFHEWAVRRRSDRPGDVLRNRLGVDIRRPDPEQLS
jgi:hypothetical protein